MSDSLPLDEVALIPTRSRVQRVGWATLVGGSLGAAALFLLDVVLFRLVCQSPPYFYGEVRTAACANGLQTAVNVLIFALATGAVVGGVVCAALTMAWRRTRSMWLLVSAAIYAASLIRCAAGSATLDLDPAATLQFATLGSAGVLLAWLATSGLAALIATRVLRRSRSG